jgi:DNA gyrase subunit B
MIAALGCGIGQDDFDLAKLRYHRIIIMTDADVDGSHIRTLLLTFFYRQMTPLVDAGHVFIAQPPLYRAKRGKGETYIKDDRELETFLVRRAVESRTVRLPDASAVSGPELERLLQRVIAHQKHLQLVERRGHSRDIVEALLDRGADRAFFADREAVARVAEALTTDTRQVSVVRDEEHNAFALQIDDRSNGYPKHDTIGFAFVTAGEYRTLAASHRELKGALTLPVVVQTTGTTAAEDEPGDGAAEPAEAPAAKARPAPRGGPRETETRIESTDALVEFFLAAGRKGVAINRYKGLGEMNPDQLWDTTMNPESRTLLQVRAEDHTEADLMFTTLMGDQVEPRRKFIEDNALDVKNLDV